MHRLLAEEEHLLFGRAMVLSMCKDILEGVASCVRGLWLDNMWKWSAEIPEQMKFRNKKQFVANNKLVFS
jgi:hypothetical protein